MAVVDRLTALLRRIRFRQWDLDGGPAPLLRLAVRAPLSITVVVALGLGAVFAAVFGVPPVSPLVLVALVVAPLYPWLRAERRLYHQWLARPPDGDEVDADAAGEQGGGREDDDPDGDPDGDTDGDTDGGSPTT